MSHDFKHSRSQEIIIICGPTASGKTAIFEEMERLSPGRYECINADTGQMYGEVSIGTARPDLSLVDQPEKYHLFGFLSVSQLFTAMDFRLRVEQICLEVFGRGRIPVIVGGSMFYINSLFFPPVLGETTKSIHEPAFNDNNSQKNTDELYLKLETIDPVRAAQIMPNDRYRILRALEIWQNHGVLPSLLEPKFNPLGNINCVWVDPGLDELSVKIEKRTKAMLAAGWIEEVQEILAVKSEEKDEGYLVFNDRLIGYKEIVNWLLAGNSSKDVFAVAKLTAELIFITRNYAKRQLKFWRNLKARIEKHNVNGQIQIIDLNKAGKFYKFD